MTNLATTPQEIGGYETFSAFKDLHVLPGCGDAYRNAPLWGRFNIIEDAVDANAIASPVADKTVVEGIYAIDGKKIENASAIPAGIYIKNGKRYLKR